MLQLIKCLDSSLTIFRRFYLQRKCFNRVFDIKHHPLCQEPKIVFAIQYKKLISLFLKIIQWLLVLSILLISLRSISQSTNRLTIQYEKCTQYFLSICHTYIFDEDMRIFDLILVSLSINALSTIKNRLSFNLIWFL